MTEHRSAIGIERDILKCFIQTNGRFIRRRPYYIQTRANLPGNTFERNKYLASLGERGFIIKHALTVSQKNREYEITIDGLNYLRLIEEILNK